MVYELKTKLERGDAVISVLGLGYVGYPLAEAFSHHYATVGYDINERLINKHKAGDSKVLFTCDPSDLNKADFIAICVPTPVLKTKEPDLRFVISAAEVIGENIKKGATVVLESTVYPGVTEEMVAKTIEDKSGLKCGEDFKVGYSPERLSPGDGSRTIHKVVKVVSGMDEETLDAVAFLYGKIANVYKAESIQTAEAAKVIENTQRDLNIALFNELSIIFDKMGIDSKSVFDAAATKWNFHRYSPGLVGGHCIPVDPYYLVYKSNAIGYPAQVILAGRGVNDGMAHYVANKMIKEINKAGKATSRSRILIMGVSYKENVPDMRSSPSFDLIGELKDWGVEVLVNDPCLSNEDLLNAGFNNIPFDDMEDLDGIIVTVPHKNYLDIDAKFLRSIVNTSPVIFDIKRIYNREELEKEGFRYLSL